MIKYQQVLSIVVESGMIYSSALVIVITFYFLNTNATCIIYDPITQVAVSMHLTITLSTLFTKPAPVVMDYNRVLSQQ